MLEHGGRDDPVREIAEGRLTMGLGGIGVDAASQHDNAVGRAVRGVPRRKARFQWIHQQACERRESAIASIRIATI